MKIVVDAMGGDYAPLEIVKGAADAAREDGTGIILVGKGQVIAPMLAECRTGDSSVSIVNATEVIDCHEHAARAVRSKRDSSIVVGMRLLQKGEASAFVSAGSTGALVSAAMLTLGKMKSIERPALTALLPTGSGSTLLLDIGAISNCKPSFLLDFARLGKTYMEKILNVANPRIALLSNGEEETKGNRLIRESHKLLKQSGLNFVGNIEAKDLIRGTADVIVTDGFTGNIVIKAIEGFGEAIFESLQQGASSQMSSQASASALSSTLQTVSKRLDYSEYGGAALLGVRGNVIVAHGRSRAKAIKSAIRLARQAVEAGITEIIREECNGQASHSKR